MTTLFDALCVGPVAVIDDEIDSSPDVKKICRDLENRNLPVIKFSSIEAADKAVANLAACNFIVLDWRFDKPEGAPIEVQAGDELVQAMKNQVIEFIKKVQQHVAAPIFILSQEAAGTIQNELEQAQISSKDRECVFVGTKRGLKAKGALAKKVQKWISQHPHIYLAKWWTIKWHQENTKLFWLLFQADPHWPNVFAKTFGTDGVDQRVALLETLNQLVFSAIDSGDLDLEKFKTRGKSNPKTLRTLYQRLVYTKSNIDKDARPGDIYFKDDAYWLNIRPECDTTTRGGGNPEIYLIKGLPKEAKDVKGQLTRSGIVPKPAQVILLCLGDHNIVVFDKRKLKVEKYNNWKTHKKWRIVNDHVAQIRQSFANYVGRFGVPSFPDGLRKAIVRG